MKKLMGILLLLCVLVTAADGLMCRASASADGQTTLEDIPVFSQLFPGAPAHLRLFGEEKKESRRQSKAGPDSVFANAGAYKPYKQKESTAFFTYGDWTLVCLEYRSVASRYLFFKTSMFDKLGSVPALDELTAYPAATTERLSPSWGPDDSFTTESNYTVPANTAVNIFFRENGYVYGQLTCSMGTVWMWLPESKVTLLGEPAPYAGTGSVKPAPAQTQKQVLQKATKEWSDWTDTPVEATDTLEVETRTLYRRKIEIEDWTGWVDGDVPEDDDERYEERDYIAENGEPRKQWRHYGFHYHYGDWTDWSEDFTAGAASSSDIVDFKTQYRYRLR